MPDNSASLHEDAATIGPAVVDRHRAVVSIEEELEAIDWYDQRIAATSDAQLAAVLAHNRDEEKEHAAMTLEWLRRRDPQLDEQLRTYLFTSGSILSVEEDATGDPDADDGGGASDDASPARPSDGSLGIGSLRDAPSL